ncbi:MAG: DUF4115 domain-containing protein [Dehalococcoidia bacterium]|nr:MAG: DUF4115 domain-containing protein [Dehalococcoidia bacterium]
MADEAWPVVLLGLRISVVLVLYLFLLSGFRALRSELRAPTFQLAPAEPRRHAPARARIDAPDRPTAPAVDGEYDGEYDPLPRSRPFGPDAPPDRPASAWRRVPLALAIPAGAAALVLMLGGAAALATRSPEARLPGGVATAPATEAFGPPVVKPAGGRVTVGLAAQEDSLVRVTVDGVVQFDGTLKARQRQAWEGTQRIQVWTDKGKTLLIAINGDNLGPYSPSMGHPDWNRIDFGFAPGWVRSDR